VKVFGRSDATLNPGGVRIGTAEIYQQTEKLPELVDSLCIGKNVGLDVDVILFVKLKEGIVLDQNLIDKIKKQIKQNTSPRHVPAQIYAVKDIPYTRSGKKMELLISRLINQKPIDNLEAVSNPESLDEFKKYL